MLSTLETPVKRREIRVAPRAGRDQAAMEKEDYRLVIEVPSCASYQTFRVDNSVLWQISSTGVKKADLDHIAQVARCFEENSRRESALQGWMDALQWRDGPSDVDAISTAIDYLIEAISNYGAEYIDLRALNYSQTNAMHLVAVLRTTYTWRHRVPGWADALRAAPEVLEDQGLMPADELFGLEF